jgi:hypothetical protein
MANKKDTDRVCNVIEDLKKVLNKGTISAELDASHPFIKILKTVTENLGELKHYAEDYHKRNAISKKIIGSSLRHKMKALSLSLANDTHLIESLSMLSNSRLQYK